MSDETEVKEVNVTQLELSKLCAKWGATDNTGLKKTIKAESRKAFERAGFKVIDGKRDDDGRDRSKSKA